MSFNYLIEAKHAFVKEILVNVGILRLMQLYSFKYFMAFGSMSCFLLANLGNEKTMASLYKYSIKATER